MDFFEILQQGADDADKKADTPEVPAQPVNERAAAKEAKQRSKAEAREAKLREKEERRQARDDEREQRRLEREADAEHFADDAHDSTEAESDPRDALAALLAGSVVADAVDPDIAATTEPVASVAAPTSPADDFTPADQPVKHVSDPPPSVPAEPVNAEQTPAEQTPTEPMPAAPIAAATAATAAAGFAAANTPADVPNVPVGHPEPDIAQKYEWTAPMPAAAAVGGTAAVVGAAGAAATGAPAQNHNTQAPTYTPQPHEPGSDDRGKQKLIAWLVVAIIALAAIVVALIFIIPAFDGSENNKPTPSPTQTTAQPTPSPTQTTQSPTPTPSPTSTNDAPVVDPGTTSPMDVPFWKVTFAVSTKFGSTQYNITGNTLLIDNAMIQSFPESCAALRTGWGITKATPPAVNGVVVAGVAYNIAKPSGTCAADPQLLNEVWGLTQAMVDSAKVMP